MRYLAVLLIALGITLAPGLSAAKRPEPKIVEIGGQVKGEQGIVHFQLRNAFTPEMIEALKSGIEISFRTQVEIERVHRNWFNVTVGERTVTRSVRYDALSRVFRLKRSEGEKLLPDIFSALAEMSRYEVVVPLRFPAIRGKKYRARVKTRLDRVGLSEPLRSIFFFSSLWDVETDWGKGALRSP
ncbi:MAG: hypothetical protein Kow00128_17520 [Deltaproteobacteria bacterium]